MRKNDVSRLEQLRPVNLKIGFAVSLFILLLAFRWTTERPALPPALEEIPVQTELKIKRTAFEEVKKIPAPDKTTVENKIIVETKLPTALNTNILLNKPADPVEPANPSMEIINQPVAKDPPPRPEEKTPDNTIFKIVEDMPVFGDCIGQGLTKKEIKRCTDQNLLSFVAEHLRYPAIARDLGIEGLVIVGFVVEKDGRVSEARVLRDIGGGCGEEALRVVQMLPDWSPGKQRGRPVRVEYKLPVKFKLR